MNLIEIVESLAEDPSVDNLVEMSRRSNYSEKEICAVCYRIPELRPNVKDWKTYMGKVKRKENKKLTEIQKEVLFLTKQITYQKVKRGLVPLCYGIDESVFRLPEKCIVCEFTDFCKLRIQA